MPPDWNKSAMRLQNHVSDVYYRGGNRFRLMNAAIENERILSLLIMWPPFLPLYETILT